MRCKKTNQYRSISILIDLLKFLFVHFLDAAGVVKEIGESVTQSIFIHGDAGGVGGFAVNWQNKQAKQLYPITPFNSGSK
ncbi:hypothetical protein [Paenibacillus sp. FSL R10-2736]|uniref:hypothetical protein n=1 Tax=Paenibacillus sp. FSL R10-2736 TaxID=2954692 RepID=UPI0030F55291